MSRQLACSRLNKAQADMTTSSIFVSTPRVHDAVCLGLLLTCEETCKGDGSNRSDHNAGNGSSRQPTRLAASAEIHTKHHIRDDRVPSCVLAPPTTLCMQPKARVAKKGQPVGNCCISEPISAEKVDRLPYACTDVVVLVGGGPIEGSKLNWGAPVSSSVIVPRGSEETSVALRFCPVAWAS